MYIIYEWMFMHFSNQSGYWRNTDTTIHRLTKTRRNEMTMSLQWRHNGRDGVSNYQPHHCLLNRLFRHRSKKTSKLQVTGLCEGKSPATGEFPSQRANNAENVSIFRCPTSVNQMATAQSVSLAFSVRRALQHYVNSRPQIGPRPTHTRMFGAN